MTAAKNRKQVFFMGLRFYKRIKILPWLYLNISQGGISFSFGPRGAHVTAGSKGTRYTVGAPGTGLSYTKYSPRKKPAAQQPKSTGRRSGKLPG